MLLPCPVFHPGFHFRLFPPRCTSSSLRLPPLFRLIHRLSKAYLFFPLFFCLCSVPSAFASIPEETEGRFGGRRRKRLPRHYPQCCSIRLCKPKGWPQPANAPPPKLRGLLRAITIKFEVPSPPRFHPGTVYAHVWAEGSVRNSASSATTSPPNSLPSVARYCLDYSA